MHANYQHHTDTFSDNAEHTNDRPNTIQAGHVMYTSVTKFYLALDPWQDQHRALQACIMDPPGDWRRRAGRPRQSWLRTVEADLRPMNLRLATAKGRAQDRSAWRILVATATSSTSS